MLRYLPVRRVHARQVLDSRGNPTVEVEVTVGEGVIGINGYTGTAMVPSGASTGKFEAVELRDGEKGNYTGLSVQKAVDNVNTKLAEAILGENALNQTYIDNLIIDTDGTENKSNLGANATLGVSMAVAKAAAAALRIPLYQYLGGCHTNRMPVPMMNILNGGRHADNTVDLQEFMIMPVGAENMEDAIRMCAEVYQFLKIILRQKNLSTGVGDEGGFAPDLEDSRNVLELIMEAVKKAGYEPGKDICIAIDAAASELYDSERGVYFFPGESRMKGKEVLRDSGEMVQYYEELIREFPIVSIEDGLEEDDWEGWRMMTQRLGDKLQLVGDDLFVTNIKRLQCGIKLKAANAILVKVNQIGTLSEALDAVEMAQRAGYNAVISHRSGETEDSFISDLAVATGAGQIKTGAPCRSDRNAKYNQLLRISEQLSDQAVYENPFKDVENSAENP
ncbi:MAG: phosphopyruvate hydratase [Clostridia bacterium]|nr:phosphopyruvate hydratase [Clostridia bacterium]MDY5555379.1 phosphopyruvate hydratase [Blautia sp.]